MKRTNEAIFKSILDNGFISKSDLQLLKNRSNKEGRDLFNMEKLDKIIATVERVLASLALGLLVFWVIGHIIKALFL